MLYQVNGPTYTITNLPRTHNAHASHKQAQQYWKFGDGNA